MVERSAPGHPGYPCLAPGLPRGERAGNTGGRFGDMRCKRRRVLDRHGGALRGKRRHRMCGVADQGNAARRYPGGVLVDGVDRPCRPRAGFVGKMRQGRCGAVHGTPEGKHVRLARPVFRHLFALGGGDEVEGPAALHRIGDEVEAGMKERGYAGAAGDAREGRAGGAVGGDDGAPGELAGEAARRLADKVAHRRPHPVCADQQQAAFPFLLVAGEDRNRDAVRMGRYAGEAGAGEEFDFRNAPGGRQQRLLQVAAMGDEIGRMPAPPRILA